MIRTNKIESAFILHRYDWSETSLILEAFVRNKGRVAVVAKGAKRPTSQLRAVLLPLQPINLIFTKKKSVDSLLNLRSAEWCGGYVMPTGKALLAGYQLNELLLRLVARDDPHPLLFDLYSCAVERLSNRNISNHQATLRVFELFLLRELGWLPNLSLQTTTQQPLKPQQYYVLTTDMGLRQVFADEPIHTLNGQQWTMLQQGLDASIYLSWQLLCQQCNFIGDLLYAQLRNLILHHSGMKTLRSRELVQDINNFSASRTSKILLQA